MSRNRTKYHGITEVEATISGSVSTTITSGEKDVSVITAGSNTFLSTRDETQLQLLSEVVVELKKMNFYLSMITDSDISSNDVKDC